MKIFNRLSWKLALITGLLILLAILAVAIPVYWLTRNSLEDQLADHLRNNLINISEDIDPQLIKFIQQYPTLTVLKDSLEKSLVRKLSNFSASAIYLIDADNNVIVAGGNKNNTIQSVLIHSPEIENTRRTGFGFSPLFNDNSGKTFKSAFMLLQPENDAGIILGLDANAQFLKYAQQLRNRVIYIGIMVLFTSIIAMMVLSQTLTRPLRLLTTFASDIGKGRAEPTRLKNRQDEIGFLGKTMEEMRLEIKQREKDNKQLIASVAHEIRNPLAGMQVNAELLLEETQNIENLHVHSRAVAKEVEKLSHIVENFLTYARPIEATLHSHSLRKLIEETVLKIKQEFPEHNIHIDGDATVLVHPNKIHHAFFNLLKNACESSDARAAITVSIYTKKDTVLIAFKNQGEPIPIDIQPQIFDVFFSTKGSGVGLGLSITKSVIEQHGGRIKLDHSDSSGTEFVIELPASKNGK